MKILVEQTLDDFELKYLRLYEKDRSSFYQGAIRVVQEIREVLGVMSITDEPLTIEQMRQMLTPKPLEPKPDARCDGCEYQHPFQEILEIDELNESVYCYRNRIHPYIKDGSWVKGNGRLMICSVYKWDNGLVRIKPYYETNQDLEIAHLQGQVSDLFGRIKELEKHQNDFLFPFIRLTKHEEAVIEILGMLIEYSSPDTSPSYRNHMLLGRAAELKAKLEGEE